MLEGVHKFATINRIILSALVMKSLLLIVILALLFLSVPSANAQSNTVLYGADTEGNLYDLTHVISGERDFPILVRRFPQFLSSPQTGTYLGLAYGNGYFYLTNQATNFGNVIPATLIKYRFRAGDESNVGTLGNYYNPTALAFDGAGTLWGSFTQTAVVTKADYVGSINLSTGAVNSSSVKQVTYRTGVYITGLASDSSGNFWVTDSTYFFPLPLVSSFYKLDTSTGSYSPSCVGRPCWFVSSAGGGGSQPSGFANMGIEPSSNRIIVVSGPGHSMYQVNLSSPPTYPPSTVTLIGTLSVYSMHGLTYGPPAPTQVWEPSFKYYYYD